MGCGSSKAIVAVEPCKMDANNNMKNLKKSDSPQVKKDDNVSDQIITSPKERVKSASSSRKFIVEEKRNDSLYGSSDSLQKSRKSSGKNRVGSSSSILKQRETSASSRGTADSGICDSERNSVRDENIITAESSPTLVKKIEVEERPSTPELSVAGQKIPERGSGKARHRKALMDARKASSQSLQSSEAETLVPEPFKRPGSVAFDVMLCPDVGNVKKKPERLARLEEQSDARRKKKSKKTISKTDIEKKLHDAEERRKNLEHEKQNKARQSQKTAHSETPVMDLTAPVNEDMRNADFL